MPVIVIINESMSMGINSCWFWKIAVSTSIPFRKTRYCNTTDMVLWEKWATMGSHKDLPQKKR